LSLSFEWTTLSLSEGAKGFQAKRGGKPKQISLKENEGARKVIEERELSNLHNLP